MPFMLRFLDLVLALTGLVLLLPVLAILMITGFFDTGSPLFRQVRVGRNQRPFVLTKFRTMKVGTGSVATHLVDSNVVTPFGRFLRKTKLDELPQLWNVLVGDMSLVGPRPCLPSQHELIERRDALGVFGARPGITGLAQINGVDMSEPSRLARVDSEMLSNFGIRQYLRMILLTVLGQGSGDRVIPGQTDCDDVRDNE